eukprot:510688-Rhodomonas_salina.1
MTKLYFSSPPLPEPTCPRHRKPHLSAKAPGNRHTLQTQREWTGRERGRKGLREKAERASGGQTQEKKSRALHLLTQEDIESIAPAGLGDTSLGGGE